MVLHECKIATSTETNKCKPFDADIFWLLAATAMRCIVAARAFEGKLLGCKDQTALQHAQEENASENAGSSTAATASPEIELAEVQEPALQLALEYAYTGAVDVADGNWNDLLLVANRMRMEGLKQVVEAFMRQPGKVTSKNVPQVLEAAHKHCAAGLKEYCMSIIDSSVHAVFADGAFLRLPKDLVADVIRRDSLAADELS